MTEMHRSQKPYRMAEIGDVGYTALLITLLALLFFGPIVIETQLSGLVIGILVLATTVAAIYGAGRSPWDRRIATALAVALLSFYLLHVRHDASDVLTLLFDTCSVLFFGFVAWVLLRDIISRSTQVSMGLINGALAVYLLMGVLFAHIYSILDTIDPAYFSGAVEGSGRNAPDFYYFSMVTLTTLGYGDIVPLRSASRMLCMLQTVTGQMYLTVLVARLVGMQISRSTATRAPATD